MFSQLVEYFRHEQNHQRGAAGATSSKPRYPNRVPPTGNLQLPARSGFNVNDGLQHSR